MTLVEKVKKELAQYNLELKNLKEFNSKFKCFMVDENGFGLKIEIEKSLQWNAVKTFGKLLKDLYDMQSKLNMLVKVN